MPGLTGHDVVLNGWCIALVSVWCVSRPYRLGAGPSAGFRGAAIVFAPFSGGCRDDLERFGQRTHHALEVAGGRFQMDGEDHARASSNAQVAEAVLMFEFQLVATMPARMR